MCNSLGPLGLILPLKAEARAVIGKTGWQRSSVGRSHSLTTSHGKTILCIQPGPGPERASAAVAYLSEQKVKRIGCLGISAGLDPNLVPGSLVLAKEVLVEGNAQNPLRMKTDQEFCQRLKRSLASMGLQAFQGGLWAGGSVVGSKREKNNLFQRFGTLTADMESGAIASQSHAIGLPCFILRTVCDPADRNVPWQLSRAITPEGNIKLMALALHVIRKPGLIRDMTVLARDYRLALTTLARAWAPTVNCFD
jgi:adenosylhomocysteine nucleosidase